MKAYQRELEEGGHRVDYLEFDGKRGLEKRLTDYVGENGAGDVVCADPHDFLVEKRLKKFSEQTGRKVRFEESPMFVTPRSWADEHFDSRKRPFMAAFYEEQRRRMGILVDEEGKPTGGQWSFDDENRKPMPRRGGLDVPNDPGVSAGEFVTEARQYVEEQFPDAPGSADSFAYPVTRDASRKWFRSFLQERFHQFGPYEDALSQRERVLFHGVLTPMLNIGLLTPGEVVDEAIAFAEEQEVPLNSLEGFVRQIIGWREFMHCMYRRHGVEMRTRNFFGHDRPVPDSFWTGETGVEPIDLCIRRALDHGYLHHIERLMVVGNFMLLCGFDPKSVNDWFMELFIDAYDWVMVPNVFGMSQFADGGIFTTKPYISGSNYVYKMSDYPKGEWCELWDALFWCFIEREREFFEKQHRLGMMVRNLDKMSAEKLKGHRERADRFLSNL